MRVFDESGFEFRVAPGELKVEMVRLCQFLMESGDLRFEPINLLILSINGVLLDVWGWWAVESDGAEGLLKYV